MKTLLSILLIISLSATGQTMLPADAQKAAIFLKNSCSYTMTGRDIKAIHHLVYRLELPVTDSGRTFTPSWNADSVIYPVIGGTAASQAMNLKNLTTNTTTGHYLVWDNNPTHNGGAGANIDWNGTTQAAETNLLQNALPLNSRYVSYATYESNNNVEFEAGVGASASVYDNVGHLGTTNNTFRSATTSATTVAQTGSAPAYIAMSRIDAAGVYLYYNGTAFTAGTGNPYTLASASVGANQYFLGQALGVYTTKNCYYSSIGIGHTDAQSKSEGIAVQLFGIEK